MLNKRFCLGVLLLLFIIVGVVGCRQSDPATPTSAVPIVQPNVILELPIVTITVSTVTPAADRVTGAAEVHDPIATPEPAATNLLAGIYDEPTPTTPDLTSDDFQEGMNYASWWQGDYQQPWTDESMQSLADTGSNWVSIIVTCYQETYVDTTITCDLPRTPTDSDLIHAIRQAHALDLNVMLKPHLDLNNDPVHWRGDIGTGFTNEAEWLAWFAGYQTFIGRYAALAEAEGVRQFSVGTELVGTSGKETAWRQVVTEVREQFSGSLVYAGNHDREATATTWWDALDYIGIDAYYPLASDNEPTKEELQAAWVTPLAILTNLAAQYNKPIIITEIGYRSVDGTTRTPWDFSLGGDVDLQEQADAYQVALESLCAQTWLPGIYWWVWSPRPEGGASDIGYTPRAKPASDILRTYECVPPDFNELSDCAFLDENEYRAFRCFWHEANPQTGPASIIGRSSVQGLLADRSYQAIEKGPGSYAGDISLASTQWLPVVMNDWCSPGIEFTKVPAYDSDDDLEGRVSCVTPAAYKVAVYIFVTGWWTKPTFAEPLTPIESDGTWTADITTGGNDHQATRIAACLVPNGYDPPLMSGGQSLPPGLFENAVVCKIVEREPVSTTVEFSGYTWNVKVSKAPAGPGPNYFSDKEEDVWVDVDGRLHMNIAFRDGRWYATEVFPVEPLGYGTYTFTLASPVDQLDKNVVLGLFTWDDTAPNIHYREIDVELSRWGEDGAKNAQFVVQPWNTAGNRHRFDMKLDGVYSTHSFNWQSDGIQFSSYQGHDMPPDPSAEIESWLYTGADIPPEGTGNARINLWLLNGTPPSDEQEVEVIIEAFQFSALE